MAYNLILGGNNDTIIEYFVQIKSERCVLKMWVWKEEDVKKGENQHSLFNERIQNSAANYIDAATVTTWIGIGTVVIFVALGVKILLQPNTIDGLINFLNYLR